MMAILLVAMLLVILIAAEIFTNALEHLGARLHISEGATGSLLAAVGTALPESIVPLIAVFAGTERVNVNEEIGVGVILGAPLMLSTLSLSLMAFSILRQRGFKGRLTPELSGLTRDLDCFLLAYGIAAVALIVPHNPGYFLAIHVALIAALVLTYFIYMLLTLGNSAQLVRDGRGTHADSRLYLRYLGLPNYMAVILFQLILGLALVVIGAKGFVHAVEHVSRDLGISVLLMSLLVVPIATELPEKINSILWIRRRKDTLAFGNITGAMVFQGTILPAIGILLTPWTILRAEVLTGVLVTYGAALWLRLAIRRGYVQVWQLGINGALYLSYLIFMLVR